MIGAAPPMWRSHTEVRHQEPAESSRKGKEYVPKTPFGSGGAFSANKRGKTGRHLDEECRENELIASQRTIDTI